jgi:hypothetical protein
MFKLLSEIYKRTTLYLEGSSMNNVKTESEVVACHTFTKKP